MVTLLPPGELAEWLEIDETTTELTLQDDAPPEMEEKLKDWVEEMEETMQISD